MQCGSQVGKAGSNLIPIRGTFERHTGDGSRGTEVGNLACCPSRLYNLQMMNGKTFDHGSWHGFKIVDCWWCSALGNSFIYATDILGFRPSNFRGCTLSTLLLCLLLLCRALIELGAGVKMRGNYRWSCIHVAYSLVRKMNMNKITTKYMQKGHNL